MTQTDRFDRQQLSSRYLTHFQRQLLGKHLKIETIPEYRQRIEIMLLADEGKTQTQICRQLNCSSLTARYWISIAKSGAAHNWQMQPIGRPKTVTSDYLDRLKELVNTSPKDLGYAFSRWTGQWLSKQLSQEFDIRISARHVNRLLGDIKAEGNLDNGISFPQNQISRSAHLIIADLYDESQPSNHRN
ncbi:helix-turn-helix domain-containing protein [Chamaesiphon sp. VAR_48_metabat_403]|uniref:helix-turn-helix domain-containing protein n=1 Tax=Chamaesiphon sp. VAR_48_metabat_403 TaxID=2964700 RepID=UPI00286DCC54|nr:helix-turn-helix domain-containing protein [Chamaesiphon sp. VAR_48_metabat_403]